MLPTPVKQKILTFPEYSMGAHLVDLILGDGRVVKSVVVAWGDSIVRVGDGEPVDFDEQQVVDALNRV